MDNYLTPKDFLYWTRELIESEKKSVKMNSYSLQENTSEYFFLKTRQKEDFVAWTFFDNSENRDYFYTYLFRFLHEHHQLNELSDDRRFFDEYYTALINSYNSLFEIVQYQKEGILMKDLISGEMVLVKETDLLKDKEERFFLLRLASYHGITCAIQVLNSMNSNFASLYARNLSEYFDSDFSKAILQDPAGVHAFLKSEAFPIFYIYSQTLQEYVQVVEELQDNAVYRQMLEGMFSEEDEEIFHTFLKNCHSNPSFSHMTEEDIHFHFFHIFMDALFTTPLNFSSIDDLDVEEIFQDLCRKGTFLTVEQFTDSLSLVKAYYQLRLAHHPQHRLLSGFSRISERLFFYRTLLCRSWQGYFYQESFLDLVTRSIKDVPPILLDFEKLLDCAAYETLPHSTTGGFTSATLHRFAEVFSLSPTKEVKRYQIYHFPYLELLLHFALSKEILFVHNNHIELHMNSYRYTELPMDIKFGIWIQTLQQDDFFLSYMEERRYFHTKQSIFHFLQRRNSSSHNVPLTMEEEAMVDMLRRMGLIDEETLQFTPFGEAMSDYFNEPKSRNNVISLSSFPQK